MQMNTGEPVEMVEQKLPKCPKCNNSLVRNNLVKNRRSNRIFSSQKCNTCNIVFAIGNTTEESAPSNAYCPPKGIAPQSEKVCSGCGWIGMVHPRLRACPTCNSPLNITQKTVVVKVSTPSPLKGIAPKAKKTCSACGWTGEAHPRLKKCPSCNSIGL